MHREIVRVCVIGAGVSGIACMKELTELGVEVEAFEMMPVLGGVYGSYGWKGGRLTSSSIFTWFSEHPVEDRQKFFTWEEFVEYLDSYVRRFGLAERIRLNCRIQSVTRQGGGWRVRIKEGNWTNGHFSHPIQEVPEREFTRDYTHLIVCSGLHNVPAVPPIEGLDRFAGRVLHSSEYRDAEDFRGRRVLIVGAGESGADIAAQVSEVARHSAISVRSAPGTLFPRFIQGNTADIRDDRVTYNLPRVWWRLILAGHRRFYLRQQADRDLFRWAAKSNYRNARCPFNTNACKSFGIPEAVIRHGALLAPEITSVTGRRVDFADGSGGEFDAIILCTGYRAAFPFLDPETSARLLPVSRLWKNCISPELGERLCLVGFSRPQQINLVSVAEMQARLVARLIAGVQRLPDEAAMAATIRRDQEWMSTYYGDRYRKNPALVDYLYYMDGVAKLIGCEVPLVRALVRDPRLWLKLMFASLNGAHYRLRGPGGNWDLAARTIRRTPQFNNWSNALLRWSVLSLLTGISLACSAFSKRFRLVKTQS